MAITFDAVVSQQGSGGSATFSHTVASSTNSILLVYVSIATDSRFVSTITYNGVSLSQAVQRDNSPTHEAEIWYLLNPSSGANNVVVTLTGVPTTGWSVASASYLGVNAIGATGGVKIGGVSTWTTNITNTSANSWFASALSVSPQSNVTARPTNNRANLTFNPSLSVDDLPTTGIAAYPVTYSTTASTNYVQVIVELIAAPPTVIIPGVRFAPDPALNPDFHQEDFKIAKMSDSSGRLNPITDAIVGINGQVIISIKTNPRYRSPDSFIDNINQGFK